MRTFAGNEYKTDSGLIWLVLKKSRFNGEIITMTELATKKLKEAIEKEGNPSLGLRIKANKDANGAVSYSLELEDKSKKDEIVTKNNGIRFLIDRESAKLIRGSKIDYSSNLLRKGFIISNPNMSCGCGPSCGCSS